MKKICGLDGAGDEGLWSLSERLIIEDGGGRRYKNFNFAFRN